ncbi:ras-related and estrogen-regulated growth inhibitor-like protein [Haliotis asinina]|uniref:ras-related and estrogen-regulated growth inhibitor-like protein n=1 Tax=Haliotis asinina TaxID=109174 RepID=UPI0035327EE6
MKTTVGSLRIVVLGARKVGKSAITVRYLTKRYIGEYSSGSDFEYTTVVNIGDEPVKLEILDTSDSQDGLTESTLRRYQADAFIVVYSIADDSATVTVQSELEKIHRGRQTQRSAVIILGNKLDLEHFRQVEADDIRPLAQKYQCRHVEISAAEDFSSVCSVFEGLLSEAFEAQKQRSKNVKRRRSILGNMSRKLGNMFKRKSLEDLLLKRRLSPSRQSARRSL